MKKRNLYRVTVAIPGRGYDKLWVVASDLGGADALARSVEYRNLLGESMRPSAVIKIKLLYQGIPVQE